jgi:glycogen operon protein
MRAPELREALAAGPTPARLGVTLWEGGAVFAVFSQQAYAIDVCLFEAGGAHEGAHERARWRLRGRDGDVRFGFIPGVRVGDLYGLRAHGPFAPERGLRFDPAKLLVDPYATRIDRPFVFDEALRIHGADTAELAPRGVVEAPAAHGAPAVLPPARAPGFIYEMNVRSWSMLDECVPQEARGTLRALACPASVERLRRLGVTHVEAMPLHAWIDEPHLARLGLRNAWGYNPVSFMALDPRLAPGGWEDLRAACAALRAAGIGLIVDVVFNHTGEGDAHGPTLSLRGLDEGLYYRFTPEGGLANDAGCGNALACARAPVVRLLMSALRRLARAGVEGFRFDLAVSLGRGRGGFSPEAPLFAAIAQDPLLRGRVLIAEPWDIGPGGYRLGAFPAPFLEWNDRYRDDVRRFWRGDEGALGAFATRICGSQDVFGPRHRPPSASVDFICAHDGFTLRDLVSFERKRNLANGEAGRDGAEENFSWNCGVEGEANAEIEAARARDMRALLATLFLSRGTPMLTAGDECGRTQAGNNNAYCQDGPQFWLDWANADMELFAFVAGLARLRARHGAFWTDGYLETDEAECEGSGGAGFGGAGFGGASVRARWLRADGAPMRGEDWRDGDLLALMCACGQGDALERMLLIFHRGRSAQAFRAPAPRPGHRWRVAFDSATAEPFGQSMDLDGEVAPRSVILARETAIAA